MSGREGRGGEGERCVNALSEKLFRCDKVACFSFPATGADVVEIRVKKGNQNEAHVVDIFILVVSVWWPAR